MQTLNCLHHHLHLPFNVPPKPLKFTLISSLFSSSSLRKPPKPTNSFLHDYLVQSFNLPPQKALSISSKYYYIKSLQKPLSVLQFLRSLGLSEPHILSCVRVTPNILFYDVPKTLKPKIEFFRQLGLVDSQHLGKFLSSNSKLLTVSLERKLIPCIEILKKILVNDGNNEDLIRVLRRCNWVAAMDPSWRLLNNVSFFENCGIVGSQLSMLLKRQPRLFAMQETKVRGLVKKVLDMGFSVDSRMLVHGVHTISCMAEETFERKLKHFRGFGYSDRECMEIFRKAPALFRGSEEKLMLRLEFFLNEVGFEKEVLVCQPACLMYSMVDRVVPRHRVLQIVNSKRLVKKDPSFLSVLRYSEQEFVEKFVASFPDSAEELLVAYKGHVLDSSSSASSEEKDNSEQKES
ncbi:uncharacterized protein LOC116139866 [Pistacia vera]|uniref:uncharacterized protein LOC116139866 n=1 Tax=Pistacia vera TaxID=55513 RepID=UPI001263D506|nr:uncharacterized protein LOC116139866 [Pistacia vera]